MSRLAELHAKVDGFFARVEARHGDDMQCATGCSDCCHVRLTITQVEATAIRELVSGWSPEQRAELRTGRGEDDRCAALDASGRCKIYAARPIVCRSHGAPIRMRKDSLPVISRSSAGPRGAAEQREGTIESCFRNFTRTEPAADCVLDQQTLSALTLAVDRDAGGNGDRVDLAGLVSELARV